MLASAYERRFSEQGDADDLVRAESAARRSIAVRPRANGPAWHALAATLMSQHRFREALVAAAQLARVSPDSPQADYIRAECDMEMGQYAAATADMHRATELRKKIVAEEDPFGRALHARLLELHGKPTDALKLYRGAEDAADADWEVQRPTVSWFHDRTAACLTTIGQSDEAQTEYKNGLAVWDRDTRAMNGLAHLAANRHDWAGAVEWGEKAEKLVPTQETSMLLYDAYRAVGRPADADRELQLVTTGGAALHAHNRAQTLFDADHDTNLDNGEALARQEIAVRKDIYSYDALAWICTKRGKIAEADTLMKSALALGTQDASLLYHDGRIALARGDKPRARADFDAALRLNPTFHPTEADVARKLLASLPAASLPTPATPAPTIPTPATGAISR